MQKATLGRAMAGHVCRFDMFLLTRKGEVLLVRTRFTKRPDAAS